MARSGITNTDGRHDGDEIDDPPEAEGIAQGPIGTGEAQDVFDPERPRRIRHLGHASTRRSASGSDGMVSSAITTAETMIRP